MDYGTMLKGDIKYMTLIGNENMQPRLKLLAAEVSADLIELNEPVSVLNTENDQQLARAKTLTDHALELGSVDEDFYVSVTISQGGLFNKSGSAIVHVRNLVTGEINRIAKWEIKPEAVAVLDTMSLQTAS